MSMFFTIRSTKRRAASRTQAGKRTILAAPRQLMTDRRSIQAAPRHLMTDWRSIQAAPRQLIFDNRRTHIAPFTTSALFLVHSLVVFTFNAVEGAISYKGWLLTCDKRTTFSKGWQLTCDKRSTFCSPAMGEFTYILSSLIVFHKLLFMGAVLHKGWQLTCDKRSTFSKGWLLTCDKRTTFYAPPVHKKISCIYLNHFDFLFSLAGVLNCNLHRSATYKGAVYYTSFILKVNDILVNTVAAPFFSEYCICVHDSLKPTTVKGAKFPTVLPPSIINTFIFSVAAPFSAVRRSILPAAVLLPFRRRSVLRKICP